MMKLKLNIFYKALNPSEMKEKDIIYSRHVEQRMKERQIEREWIEETVLNPDLVVVKAENEVLYFKKFIRLTGKFLKVVFNPIKGMVVTAHFDEKMTKTKEP